MIRSRGAGVPLPPAPARPAPPRPTRAAGAPDPPEEGRHFLEDSPAAPSRQQARLRQELASPAALRRAIVVREVLGPPKGLR